MNYFAIDITVLAAVLAIRDAWRVGVADRKRRALTVAEPDAAPAP